MPKQRFEFGELSKVGPTLNISVLPPKPVRDALQKHNDVIPSSSIYALIDTGASHTSIDHTVVKDLDLVAHNIINVQTPGGETQQYTYEADFVLNEILPKQGFYLTCLSADLNKQSHDALLGRDVLEYFTLIYNGWENAFYLHI